MCTCVFVQTHTKWQQRKEALETLLKLTGNPKLEPGEYGELMRMLKKVLSACLCIMTYTLELCDTVLSYRHNILLRRVGIIANIHITSCNVNY